ncbi:MAG TPA: hypothetical protein VI160_08570 [Gemmatimonadales bacterium]
MRALTLTIVCAVLGAAPLAAQDSIPAVHRDSADSARMALAQERWMDGLRLAARGVAQLKTGVDKVRRSQAGRDTVRLRQTGRLFAGFCGTARGFMVNGRAKMSSKAFDPPQRDPTKDVAVQIDSLIAYSRTCEQTAGKNPGPVADGMIDRLRRYETAIAAFRVAFGLAAPTPPPANP